jgi:hypothetical protein
MKLLLKALKLHMKRWWFQVANKPSPIIPPLLFDAMLVYKSIFIDPAPLYSIGTIQGDGIIHLNQPILLN